MLSRFLTADNIQFRQSVPDWQTAIRAAAEPLVLSGTATNEYVESMVASVQTHGPYIVVDDGLALPHARPEDGARRPGMSMLILAKPVDLLGNRVTVLIALAATDATSHLTALQELAELVWNGGTAEKLASFTDPAAVAAYIQSHTKEAEA